MGKAVTPIVRQAQGPGEWAIVKLRRRDTGAEYPLRAGILLGRAAECDAVIAQESVSRRHARVEDRGGELWIVDLGSSNGTRWNGRLTRAFPLRPGDLVTLGAVPLEVTAEEGDHVRPAPPAAEALLAAGPAAAAAEAERVRLRADLAQIRRSRGLADLGQQPVAVQALAAAAALAVVTLALLGVRWLGRALAPVVLVVVPWLSFAACAAGAPAAQESQAPPSPPPPPPGVAWADLPAAPAGGGADFALDLAAPGRPIPPGLVAGINDFPHSSLDCWKAYGQALRPQGGLARIWCRYWRGERVGERHFRAGRAAQEIGLSVMFTAVGFAGAPRRARGEARGEPGGADAGAWAGMVAADVERLLRAGVPVTHVEIWNEPDIGKGWDGTREAFAEFFAAAGAGLKERLPDIAIGGPGMSHAYTGALEFLGRILDACRARRFRPDFLSWHDYVGYPTDQEAFRLPDRVAALARERDLGAPELILSEWNKALPVSPELDDHRNGAYFVAMTASLAQTTLRNSIFFFLQDGPWEAKEEYAGQSVGVFTLRGGPKAVLNGMQMARMAAELPAVPVERLEAPWNLVLLATRAGERGFLLAANSAGEADRRVRKLLDFAGVDLSAYKGRDRAIRDYLAGRVELDALGAPASQRAAWEEARRFVRDHNREAAARSRPVRVRVSDPPQRIAEAWLLDSGHGDPWRDPDYRRFFGEVAAEARGRAADAAVRLLQHPACRPAAVPVAGRFSRDGSTLVFDLPPDSALLVALRWSQARE